MRDSHLKYVLNMPEIFIPCNRNYNILNIRLKNVSAPTKDALLAQFQKTTNIGQTAANKTCQAPVYKTIPPPPPKKHTPVNN